jgi:hypothetical protein
LCNGDRPLGEPAETTDKNQVWSRVAAAPSSRHLAHPFEVEVAAAEGIEVLAR